MSALSKYLEPLAGYVAALLAKGSRLASSADAQEFTNFSMARDLTLLGDVQGVEILAVTTPGATTSITGETKGSGGVKRTYWFDSLVLPYRLPVQMKTIDSVVNITRMRVYLPDVS